MGLTGGIGCGKSTVCRKFSGLGVPTIDTDALARDVAAPGTPGLRRVADAFGSEVLHADGSLDRHALRRAVFGDPEARRHLEAILHPLIHEQMERHIATLTAPYVVIAIPLLIEAGWQGAVDRILVVDCAESQQIRRTVQRDRLDEQEVRAIIAAQLNREARLAQADDVLHNDGTEAELEAQVGRLHVRYLEISARQRG